MNGGERLAQAARSIVAGTAESRDRALLENAHPADIAAALPQPSAADQATVVRTLSQERAGELFAEMDDETLLAPVRALDEVEVSCILDEMPPEDAADVVEELPSEQAEKIR